MSFKKFLVLAVVSAIAAMSMAASASATTRITCGAGVTCSSTQTFNGTLATGTHATLTTNLGNITCTSSTILGKINGTNPGATNVPIQITSISFPVANCTSNVLCGTTVNSIVPDSLPYSGTATATSSSGGTLAVNGVSVTVSLSGNCGFSVNCTYSGNVSGTFTNSNSQVVYSSALGISSGSGCPSSATWDGTYVIRTGTTPGSGTLVTTDNA